MPRDLALAYRYTEQAATLGMRDARFQLGLMHEQGLGVPVTPTEAAYHYRLAALEGHLGALRRLAEFYLSGKGVSPDPDRAIFWLQRLASVSPDVLPTMCDLLLKKGEYESTIRILDSMRSNRWDFLSGYAHYRLSRLYEFGLGVKKDSKKAKKYLGIAIEKGDASALVLHGMDLMEQNRFTDGISAFERAAKSSGEANFYLGQIYYHGTGAPKDEAKGLSYFLTGAKLNNRDALYYLAALSFNGATGAPSLDEAVQYARQAEALGHAKAGEIRAKLEQRRQKTSSPHEQTAGARSS